MTGNRHYLTTVAEKSYPLCLGLCHTSYRHGQHGTCFSPLYKTTSSSQKIAYRPSVLWPVFHYANSDLLFHSVLGMVSLISSHFQSSWNFCWSLGLKCLVCYFPAFSSFWLWTTDKLINSGIKTCNSSQACHNSQVRATHSSLPRLAGMRETGTPLSFFEPF